MHVPVEMGAKQGVFITIVVNLLAIRKVQMYREGLKFGEMYQLLPYVDNIVSMYKGKQIPQRKICYL
jgi:hypothetical protein